MSWYEVENSTRLPTQQSINEDEEEDDREKEEEAKKKKDKDYTEDEDNGKEEKRGERWRNQSFQWKAAQTRTRTKRLLYADSTAVPN